MKNLHLVITAFCLLLIAEQLQAQDLDPRAYAWIPVSTTFLSAGYGYSHGGVLTDPSLPVTDINATVNTPSFAAGHTFGLFGKTAQVMAALPYSWADVSGMVGEGRQSVTRSGLNDMRLRFSVLFHGAPASTPAEFAKAQRRTILGASLSVIAPTGQYLHGKLINLGTARWAFKPEFALSHPVSNKWLLDLYAGLWFFTKNNSFYPGNSVRSQNPMGAFQGHISYNFNRRMWAAFDLTYYTGGMSTVNGVDSNDRQENSRAGATMVLPVGKQNSLKIAYSRGAIIRFGANFSTFSIGWQTSFFGKQKKSQV
jgi:hypothetical protein